MVLASKLPAPANKLSVCTDMTNPLGRDVARKLILEWADVVVDSFTQRVMPGWGLSIEEPSKTRPDLIMLSTCMQGQTGPHRDYAGFGDQGAALSGFFMLNGWPDRDRHAREWLLAPRRSPESPVADVNPRTRGRESQATPAAVIQYLASAPCIRS